MSDVLIVLVLVVCHGCFAGAEIAVVSLRKTRLRQLVEEGRSSARAIEFLRKNPERFLATVQIFITVVGTLIASRGAPTIERLVAPAFEAIGIPTQYGSVIAYAFAVGAISFGELVIGELVPKSLALRASEPYSMIAARPLMLMSTLARPAVWVLEGTSNLFLRIFGDKTSFIESRLSPEELTQLLEEAGRAGTLDARASDIAVRAIELDTLTGADVMVPRNRVVVLEKSAGIDELKRLIVARGHQRYPVHEEGGTADEVVGYVAAKDVLNAWLSNEPLSIDELIRPATFFPESMKATAILKEMQGARVQLAIVVDERGGMAGILTMEDLLEELVGDIWSEDDRALPTPVRKTKDGSAVVLGSVPIREVNRALDIGLPEGDLWTTLAGYCIALAGRIPESGARLEAEDGTILEILESTPRRIRSVRVVRGKKEKEEPTPSMPH
jgi:putative hemolysin